MTGNRHQRRAAHHVRDRRLAGLRREAQGTLEVELILNDEDFSGHRHATAIHRALVDFDTMRVLDRPPCVICSETPGPIVHAFALAHAGPLHRFWLAAPVCSSPCLENPALEARVADLLRRYVAPRGKFLDAKK